MADRRRRVEPQRSTPEALDPLDPRHRWDRPLQAPGHMQVDFEERVDFRRLHAYRLPRTRPAPGRAGGGGRRGGSGSHGGPARGRGRAGTSA